MMKRGTLPVFHIKAHLCRVLPHFSAFFRLSPAVFCPHSLSLLSIHPTSLVRPVYCADTGINSAFPFSPVFCRIFPCFAARILCPKGMLVAAKEVVLAQRLRMPDRRNPFLTVMATMNVVILTRPVFRAYSRSQTQLHSVGDAKKRPHKIWKTRVACSAL